MKVKISVVMVDGSFRENFHIIGSLASQTFPEEDYEVLWVEFYADVNDSLKENDDIRVITLGNSPDKEYHSSYCFNEGIRQSKGEVLIIPDADVMVEPTLLETVWKEHQSCGRLAMYFHRLNEPKELHDKSRSYSLAYLKNQTRATTTSNFGGCL
ncbi:MAG: glycosyltransferase family A protein, partial [Gallionella sp.]